MQTLHQVQLENKALTLALKLAVTALRIAPTTAVGLGPNEEPWPECPHAALKRVWAAMFPLLGHSPVIADVVAQMSAANPDPEDQGQLLLRWANLQFGAVMCGKLPVPV